MKKLLLMLMLASGCTSVLSSLDSYVNSYIKSTLSEEEFKNYENDYKIVFDFLNDINTALLAKYNIFSTRDLVENQLEIKKIQGKLSNHFKNGNPHKELELLLLKLKKLENWKIIFLVSLARNFHYGKEEIFNKDRKVFFFLQPNNSFRKINSLLDNGFDLEKISLESDFIILDSDGLYAIEGYNKELTSYAEVGPDWGIHKQIFLCVKHAIDLTSSKTDEIDLPKDPRDIDSFNPEDTRKFYKKFFQQLATEFSQKAKRPRISTPMPRPKQRPQKKQKI